MEKANSAIAASKRADKLRSAIGRVIVDEDRLPGDSLQSILQPSNEFRNILAFVEGGQHNGQIDTRLCRMLNRERTGIRSEKSNQRTILLFVNVSRSSSRDTRPGTSTTIQLDGLFSRMATYAVLENRSLQGDSLVFGW